MASWYSKLLTTTSSQISNLQSRILSGENDGDTEDDTHVCRVLRAYYTEQGKPFPGWLPPDPKAPPPVVAPVYNAQPQVGSRYGGLAQQQPGGPGGSSTGLSSLWDSSGGARQGGAPAAGSLRQGQFARGSGSSGPGRGEPQARPLPSQRGGSYQAQSFGRDSGTTPPSGSSAQDKLKQRLWGGGGARTTSPSSGTSGPFQPPGRGRAAPPGGRGGGGDYEARFAPGGMYDPSTAPSGRSNRPVGLPGGPRGLPSGPRMR